MSGVSDWGAGSLVKGSLFGRPFSAKVTANFAYLGEYREVHLLSDASIGIGPEPERRAFCLWLARNGAMYSLDGETVLAAVTLVRLSELPPPAVPNPGPHPYYIDPDKGAAKLTFRQKIHRAIILVVGSAAVLLFILGVEIYLRGSQFFRP